MPNSNVLLIDDDAFQHELFNCYALKTQMVEVSCAITLDEGLLSIDRDCPDVILLDNRLVPYETYKETIPQIRANGYEGKIVVISTDVDGISDNDMDEYSIFGCMDKLEFDLMNFEEKINKLTIN